MSGPLRIRWGWLFAGLALLTVVLPLALWVGLRLGLATPLVNFTLKRELGPLFKGEVRFGLFRTDLLSYAEVTDLRVLAVRENGNRLPVLTVDRVRMHFRLWEVLRGRRPLLESLDSVTLKGTRFFMLRSKKGEWNIRQVLVLPDKRTSKAKRQGGGVAALATRLSLQDSEIIFNDEARDFQSAIEGVQGQLDTRAFPLVVFSLSGRTEGRKRENLTLAGEWNAQAETFYARADLKSVSLESYFNYMFPRGGLAFTGGQASMSVRALDRGESEIDFSGQADVDEGVLRIPGVAEPLGGLKGRLAFDRYGLRVTDLRARFLGSMWVANGRLDDYKAPRLELHLSNPRVPLQELSRQIRGLASLRLAGDASLALTATGRAAEPEIRGILQAPEFDIAGVSLQQAHAELSMDTHVLKVLNLRGQLWGSPVSATAEIEFPRKKGGSREGRLEASFTAPGVALADVAWNKKHYLPLSGRAKLEAQVSGPLRQPIVTAIFRSEDSAWGTEKLGELELSAQIKGKSLSLGLQAWGQRLKAHSTLHFGAPGARIEGGELVLDHFPLRAMARALSSSAETEISGPRLRKVGAYLAKSLEAELSCRIGIEGPMRKPDLVLDVRSLQGIWFLSESRWLAKGSRIPFEAKGLAELGADWVLGKPGAPFRLLLKPAGKETSFEAQGRLAADGSGQGMSAKISADMAGLRVSRLFKKAQGRFDLDLKLSGSPRSRNWEGWAELKDFDARMKAYLPQLRQGEFQAWFKEKSVVIENLSFRSDGIFLMSGELDFSAGLLPRGQLKADTDTQGIKLEDAGIASAGYLALSDLMLTLNGPEGLQAEGGVRFHDTVFRLEGGEKGKEEPELGAKRSPYQVVLDLHIGLDENVWLKKLHSKGVDITLDPVKLIQSGLASAEESLRNPSMEFKFRPTSQDLSVQGQVPKVSLLGTLAVERGLLTFQENDFIIKPDLKPPHIDFKGGLRADIELKATAQLRYYRDNASTGRAEAKPVKVILDVVPLKPLELEAAGLQNALLNYKLDFSSDPPLMADHERERMAILSLLLLGDPMHDQDPGELSTVGVAPTSGSRVTLGQLVSNQVGRLASSELKKLANRGFKVLGAQGLDYIRLAPKFGKGAGGTSQSAISLGSPTLVMEAGKSLYKDLYASGQLFIFGEDDVNSARSQTLGQKEREVRGNAWLTKLEYFLSPQKILEISVQAGVDENQEPFAYDPTLEWGAWRYYFGLRSSIPTETYGRLDSRRRQRLAAELAEARPQEANP